jgi:Holliday junction resolvasome RuvABC ATP-dependent DNA helicase subunit
MAKPLFLKHYDYLLEDPEVFDIFFHGTAFSTSENKQNDLIVITGKKGSGKTEIAKVLNPSIPYSIAYE